MGKILQGHSLWFRPSPDWQLAPHARKLPFLIRKMTPRKMNLLLKRQKWYWRKCGKGLTLASNLTVTDTQDVTSAKRTWLKGWRDHSSSSNTFATYIHKYFMWNSPPGLIMLSTKAIDYVSKAPTPGIRIPLLSYWYKLFKRFPTTLWATAVVCGYLPEVEGETLLLKTLWTSDTGLRGPELDLAWKPPPWG